MEGERRKRQRVREREERRRKRNKREKLYNVSYRNLRFDVFDSNVQWIVVYARYDATVIISFNLQKPYQN